MDRTEELRIVSALRAGDESAFAAIYDAYRAILFSFILRMVGRRPVAEELSQEVWMRLATRARTLREDTRLGAWLFTVARNLCVSYWRTTAIQTTEMDALGHLATSPSNPIPPDEAAALAELHRRLEDALAALAPPLREAILLVGVHGMTPAEASAVCGVTPEAMRKRLERARAMLAREMEADARRQPVARHGIVQIAPRRGEVRR